MQEDRTVGPRHGTCNYIYIYVYIYIYRVSHELRSLLRKSVRYVKIYRYNPKHLCPKLNGYGDNGKRKMWTSWGCTHYTCQLAVIYVRPSVGCHVTECAVSHVSQASHVTSAFGIPVSCIVLRTLRITMTRVRMFLYFNLMALCHSQVTLMLSTAINITETTYSCQFQYEFGNQYVSNSCHTFKLLLPLSP